MKNNNTKPGYHIKNIPKGVLGKSSKILEEVLELMDAEEQKSKVMCLVELSDLLGAIKAYLEYQNIKITLEDLENFSLITKRAFINGHRK